MGQTTKIAWCNHTFNPWWGCQRVSAGCDHCYAEAKSRRFGYRVFGPDVPRRRLSDANWAGPLKWNEAAANAGVRRRVFCGSMCDVFEPRLELVGQRDRLFSLVERTPWIDWLLLTKRPEEAGGLVPESWREAWPPNAWSLTTVECQAVADQRITALLSIPAAVRGLSCEPMLGRVDIVSLLNCLFLPARRPWLPWVIIGCESGPQRRPCNEEWVRGLVQQCRCYGVAVFVKQIEVNGRVETDPDKWPEDLRIQEFPR